MTSARQTRRWRYNLRALRTSWLIGSLKKSGNDTLPEIAQQRRNASRCHTFEVTMKLSRRLLYWNIKRWKRKKMSSNASPHYSGRVDVNLSGHVKSLARKVQARTGLVRSAIYPLLLSDISWQKQTPHKRCSKRGANKGRMYTRKYRFYEYSYTRSFPKTLFLVTWEMTGQIA